MTDPLTFKQSRVYIWTQIGELNDTSDDGGTGAGTGISNSRTAITVRADRFNGESDSTGHRIEQGMDILIDSEMMKVTACSNRTDTSITVARGEHTNAKIGSIGGAAAQHLTAAKIFGWTELKDFTADTTLVQGLTITDNIYEARMLELVLSNPPQTSRYGVGDLEGLILEKTPIKVVDGANYSVLFSGKIARVTKQHALAEGNTIEISAFDSLYEMGRSKLTGEDAVIKLCDANGSVVSIANGGINQSSGGTYKISEIIQAYIQRFQHEGSTSTLGLGSNTTTVETVSGSTARFDPSFNSKKTNGVTHNFSLGVSNQSVLKGITRLALSDEVRGNKFGYSYYIDPNQTSFSAAHKPAVMFNYFQSSHYPGIPQSSTPMSPVLRINHDDSTAVSENGITRLMKPGASFDNLDIEQVNIINVRYRDKQGVLRQLEMEVFNYKNVKNTNNSLSTAYETSAVGKALVAPFDSSGNAADRRDKHGVHDPNLNAGSETDFEGRVVDADGNLIGYLQYASNVVASSGDEAARTGFALLSGTSTRRANSNVVAGEKLYLNKVSNNDYFTLTDSTSTEDVDPFRPQTVKEEKIVINMDFGMEDNYHNIREAVAARIQQSMMPKVRGRFQVDRNYPYFSLENQLTGSDTITTTSSGSYTINEVTDADAGSGGLVMDAVGATSGLQAFGVRAGHSIIKLTAQHGTAAAYGYIAKTDNDEFTTVLNTGNLAANDYVRIYVPLRAGATVSVDAPFHNIDVSKGGRMVVTSLVYTESAASAYTDIETIGLRGASAQETISAYRPSINNLDDYVDDDYAGSFAPFSYDGVAHFTGRIAPGLTSGAATGIAINWTEGLLYYNGTEYDIAAGDTTGTSIAGADADNDGMADTRFILYFEPTASETAFQFSTEFAYEARNARGGRESATTNTFPYSQQSLTIAKFWGSATNGHASASNGAKAKIVPSIRLGASRKQDGSATYSGSAADTGGQPPFVVGGNMLAGDVNNSWVPTADDTYNLGTITGGTGSTDFRWKDLFINPSATGDDTALHILTSGDTGKVVKLSSSARYKKDIKNLNDAKSNKIYDLNPKSFKYKSSDRTSFGLIAEEVEPIMSELIVYDEEGRPDAVKYNSIIVLLLQELKNLRQEIDDLKNEAKE